MCDAARYDPGTWWDGAVSRPGTRRFFAVAYGLLPGAPPTYRFHRGIEVTARPAIVEPGPAPPEILTVRA
jgi:hypothetical protein